MNKIVYGLLLSMVLMVSGCSNSQIEENSDLVVAVTVGPEKAFVEGVAGDLAQVVVMVPPGGSPTNYQPSPKEMQAMSQASVYFAIGVGAEVGILNSAVITDEKIEVIDLQAVVAETYPARYFEDEADEEEDHDHEDHDHSGRDPHIWMSPKRAVLMVAEIERVLSTIDPDHADVYKTNAATYTTALEAINQTLQVTLNQLDNKTFIVMHPSLGYFADDYGLQMVAIEEDGKEASALHMEEVIRFAKDEGIKAIFYQQEFDRAQADLIASEIDGEALAFEPLSEDYIANMEKMMAMFQAVLMDHQ